MNKHILLFIYILFACTGSISVSYAASYRIVAPTHASSYGANVVVTIMIDPEQQSLSGFSGDLSFPKDMFDIDSITTQGSIISLWSARPEVSKSLYLDGRIHIPFEGITPGGFTGVRSPYYAGGKPGVIFSVVLKPKSEGTALFLLDNLLLTAFDENATNIPTNIAQATMIVPKQTTIPQKNYRSEVYIYSQSLRTYLTKDVLVTPNSWHLTVSEDESTKSIRSIQIAETNGASAFDVALYEWRPYSFPYTLRNQNRNKYIHVKVIYNNNTYTTATIQPVENLSNNADISRILMSIVLIAFAIILLRPHVTTLYKQYKKNKTI